MTDIEQKELLKQALKEWLDGKFAAFGRWSFYSISSAAFTALMYFILSMSGWKYLGH